MSRRNTNLLISSNNTGSVALEKSDSPMIAQKATDFREEVTSYTKVLTAQVVRSTQNSTVTNRRTDTDTVRGKQVVNQTH